MITQSIAPLQPLIIVSLVSTAYALHRLAGSGAGRRPDWVLVTGVRCEQTPPQSGERRSARAAA